MAEVNASNEDISKGAQQQAGQVSYPTEGVDAEKAAANAVIPSATARAAEPLEIEEQGMDAEAIEQKAAKQNEDVKAAIDEGARFVQHPNSPVSPGLNDSGKYVRSTAMDERVAADEETRESAGDGTAKREDRDRHGRDYLHRVRRSDPISDELIDQMSAADLQAVATDRGYNLSLTGGRRSTAEAFRKAQSEDKLLGKSSTEAES